MPTFSPASSPPFRERFIYASGNMGKSWVWATFDSVLLYYLSTVLGLPLSVAGHILMLSLLWDGASNLLLSYGADRVNNRHVFRYFLLSGAPLCAASFFLIFYGSNPQVPPQALWVGMLCLLCRTGYTLCDVAHNSMLANMSTTSQGASSVSALRLIFSATGSIGVGLGFKYALASPPEQQLAAFVNVAALGASLYLVMVSQSALLPQSRIRLSDTGVTIGLLSTIRRLFRDKTFQTLCVLASLHAGIITLFYKGLPFLGKTVLLNASWSGDALIYITIGKVAVLVGVQFAVSRLPSLHAVFRLSYAALGLALVLIAVTMSGLSPALPPLLLLIGGAEAGIGMCLWAMLSTFVHAAAARDGLSLALPFGVFLALLKAANGVGSEIFTSGINLGVGMGCTQTSALIITTIIMPISACLLSFILVKQLRQKDEIPDTKGH